MRGRDFMEISLRFNEEETLLIKSYARQKNMSVSELIRQTVLEKIEDEFDLEIYEKSIAEYKANPVVYPHEKVKAMLEIDD